MDIALIKTFLEVAATGSFVSASERLFVTQSAVSLRIQRLEDQLGRPLFTRSKAGAEMTPAGRQFETYALSLLRVWEEARQQVALPAGFERRLSIGAQYSLWPRLGFRLIDALRDSMPDLSIRAEIGMPDRLTRFMVEGITEMALMYTPQLRPSLNAEKLMDEELILVASWPEPTMDLEGRYLFVDWGPEFVQAHALHLPELTHSGLTLSLGALAADFIVRRQAAAYLPARFVKRYIDAGQLHLVPDAPVFPYPVWTVWRDDLNPEIAEAARAILKRLVLQISNDQGDLLKDLADLSESGETQSLGTETNF